MEHKVNDDFLGCLIKDLEQVVNDQKLN
uniref:Uncharacterized protein n=1 Tax=Lepeophtheirus salmonis TaxID=72036 RepID=A0A0K2TP42_LEPSM